jgi:hypothetical protein
MKRTIIHSNGLSMKGKTQTIVTSEEMEKKRKKTLAHNKSRSY